MKLATTLLVLLLAAPALAAPPADSGRRYVNLPGRSADLPLSDGMKVGGTFYLSGRLGTDPKTGQIPADVEQEIRFLLDSVKAVLAEGGMTPDDLVSVQVFCSDLALYDKFNSLYRAWFTAGRYPARAFLGSGPLLRGAHFELQGIAVKR
jgi:2-iminobutanoate/2-iminopropanoate deaminase